MFDRLSDLPGHPAFQGLLGVITILSLALAVIGSRTKVPTWSIRSHNLIRLNRTRLPGFSATWHGQVIENLTITLLMFWNTGREPIRSTDIAPADPLRVVLAEGVQLLAVNVVASNSPASRFTVIPRQDTQSIDLTFDFAEKGDGVVIEIVHTGTRSTDVSLVGTVIGAKAVTRRRLSLYGRFRARLRGASSRTVVRELISAAYLAFLPSFGIVIVGLALLGINVPIITDPTLRQEELWRQWLVFVGLQIVTLLLVTRGASAPRGLEGFLAEIYETSDATSDGYIDVG